MDVLVKETKFLREKRFRPMHLCAIGTHKTRIRNAVPFELQGPGIFYPIFLYNGTDHISNFVCKSRYIALLYSYIYYCGIRCNNITTQYNQNSIPTMPCWRSSLINSLWPSVARQYRKSGSSWIGRWFAVWRYQAITPLCHRQSGPRRLSQLGFIGNALDIWHKMYRDIVFSKVHSMLPGTSELITYSTTSL